ncbi:MAG: CaiB/BaiF CoA transferase family protein [Acidimicrobiia bacterium]
MTSPMKDIRIVEVAMFGFVPTAAAVLSDLGANVIKIEHPQTGDPVRGVDTWDIPAGFRGVTYLWEVFNRNKRSVGLDLGTDEGHQLLMELVDVADVFLTSFLPDARQRLRIDVDDIRARNSRVIYGRGSATGPAGPEAAQGGFDGVAYWHRSGIGSGLVEGSGDYPPTLPGPGFGDIQSGMNLAGGIAAALFHRERTGQATVVDTSLLGSGLWAMQGSVAASSVTGRQTMVRPDRSSPPNPISNIYATADGRFISLAMLQSDRYWPGFVEALGAPELMHDARFISADDRRRNAADCVKALDERFALRSLSEWIERLAAQEGPWAVVNQVGNVFDDVQADANGYLHRIDVGSELPLVLVGAPVQFDRAVPRIGRAPELGAHTEEVLLELGRSWEDIAELKGKGVVN